MHNTIKQKKHFFPVFAMTNSSEALTFWKEILYLQFLEDFPNKRESSLSASAQE